MKRFIIFQRTIKDTTMPRNLEIENQLLEVYERDYEFVEPYDGNKGHYPAEIFIQTVRHRL